jgi:hypothetical protein
MGLWLKIRTPFPSQGPEAGVLPARSSSPRPTAHEQSCVWLPNAALPAAVCEAGPVTFLSFKVWDSINPYFSFVKGNACPLPLLPRFGSTGQVWLHGLTAEGDLPQNESHSCLIQKTFRQNSGLVFWVDAGKSETLAAIGGMSAFSCEKNEFGGSRCTLCSEYRCHTKKYSCVEI